MLGISGFFKNIQNVFAKEVFLRTAIGEIIKKQTGFDLKIEDITCKSGTIKIKTTNSSALSAIYIKKNRILEEIRQVSRQDFFDIRSS